MTIPFTRSLPYVLREQLQQRGPRVLVGVVAAVPDSERVTIEQNGSQVTIPRISSYTPTVGEPAFCLASAGGIMALGAVGGVTGGGGEPGPPGTPGEVWYLGPSAPAGSLGIVGDLYLNTSNGDYYEKTGASAWTLRGNLTGPQGATGAQGPQGNTGPQGATGAQGPKGDTGATGAQGATGPPGPGVAAGGAANQVLAKRTTTDYDTQWISPAAVPDASPTVKGILQLAGDLAGSAASPQIAAGVIVDADVAAAAAIGGRKLRWSQGATPPASPADGDFWLYPVPGTIGGGWLFRYTSSDATYPWWFIGGVAMYAETPNEDPTTAAGYTSLATAGPSLTVPRAGYYQIELAFYMRSNYGTATALMSTSPGAGDGNSVREINSDAVNSMGMGAGKVNPQSFSAGQVVTAQYRTITQGQGGTIWFSFRRMWITPIRVS